MASPADSSSQDAVIRKQNKGAPIKFLVPLIYAPVLPLIRLSLRKNPVLRDRLFTAVLAGAFVHGFYLVLTLADSIQVIVWDGKSIRMQKLVGITRHEELTYMMLRANKHAQHELLRAI